MYRDDVMTPDHPRWKFFIEELSRSLICTRTTQNAQRVLKAMGKLDVEASLEALRLLHGRCDCEIVFELGELQQLRA